MCHAPWGSKMHNATRQDLVAAEPGGGEDGELDPLADQFDRTGVWRVSPRQWRINPERLALSAELREVLTVALRRLPPGQRAIVELRDMQGLGAQEVCTILDISAPNQRVLLHVGRTKLCAALAATLET